MNVSARILTIGALAKAAGVSAPTIRYYEEIGLLPPASRTSGGQRNYDPSDLARLSFIKQCRDFGFGIVQVRTMLNLSVSTERDCIEARDIAQTHLDDVRAKMSELRTLEKRLADFVERCDLGCAGGVGRDCVIFKEMAPTVPRKTRTGCCS